MIQFVTRMSCPYDNYAGGNIYCQMTYGDLDEVDVCCMGQHRQQYGCDRDAISAAYPANRCKPYSDDQNGKGDRSKETEDQQLHPSTSSSRGTFGALNVKYLSKNARPLRVASKTPSCAAWACSSISLICR